jgi:hypothetical protein
MRSDEANRNDCDNDVGRSCAELWPADRASWCQGCLDAHEPSVPVSALRALLDRGAAAEHVTSYFVLRDGIWALIVSAEREGP